MNSKKSNRKRTSCFPEKGLGEIAFIFLENSRRIWKCMASQHYRDFRSLTKHVYIVRNRGFSTVARCFSTALFRAD